MPGDDAAWVARCPGWALRLLRFAGSLSDRHIGAAQGGRQPRQGHPGRGVGRLWAAWWQVQTRCRSTAFGHCFSDPLLISQSVQGASGGCPWVVRAAAGRGAGSCDKGRVAGLSSQVSVSWVMGLAGFQPPPCPSSPARVGEGGSRVQAARGAAKRGCNPALTRQGCAERAQAGAAAESHHTDACSFVSLQNQRPW